MCVCIISPLHSPFRTVHSVVVRRDTRRRERRKRHREMELNNRVNAERFTLPLQDVIAYSLLGSYLLMQFSYTVRSKGQLAKHHGVQCHPRGPDITGLPLEVTLVNYTEQERQHALYSAAGIVQSLYTDANGIRSSQPRMYTSEAGLTHIYCRGLLASKNP